MKLGIHVPKTVFHGRHYFLATFNQFFKRLFNFKEEKRPEMAKKCGNCATETFTALVVSMVISPLLITVAEFKISAVSSKSYVVASGVIVFL